MSLSYYNRPALKPPHWGWNVVTYLFLGGVMGGSAIIGAIADDPKLRRTAKATAFALAAVNPPLLISHLGRPERFLNMLRIFKAKSPMSMGVWGLMAFSGVAGLSLLLERANRRSGMIDALSLLTGAFVCGYTGVLLSATANPLWGKGKFHVPAFCVASGVAGACALNGALLGRDADPETAVKLERLETAAAAAELALLLDFRRTGGPYVKPMFEGTRGDRFTFGTILCGIAGPMLLNGPSLFSNKRKHSFGRTIVAAALTLAGGYILRQTLIEAGKAAAEDPHLGLNQPK
jgi:formate-dependent nitrite reductase membrane component NrfD